MTAGRRGDLVGGAWLISDMLLNVWALTIVKALGLGYPASQIVFLRALTGLVLIAPFVWHGRAQFRDLRGLPLHGLRIVLSTLALSLSFHAVARLPFALFTAVNFTRPLVLMTLAALLLGERIGKRRWIAAAVALLGVLIAVEPGPEGLSPALIPLFGAVLAGTSAVIVIRRQAGTPVLVMMTLYTGGLTVLSAPVALLNWVPVAGHHLLPLLAIGLFAQTGQACFLRAHGAGRAGFLAVLGYLSLLVSATVGYLVFDEVPTLQFLTGAALVVSAALWVTLERQRAP